MSSALFPKVLNRKTIGICAENFGQKLSEDQMDIVWAMVQDIEDQRERFRFLHLALQLVSYTRDPV